MFGYDENQGQNQNHNENTPISSAPLPDNATDNASSATPVAAASGSDNTPGIVAGASPSVVSPSPIAVSATSTDDNPAPSDLLDIKQEALQHLSPLVSQLDQAPEEKFRTTMMMIQASDDQSLVKEAFECAKKITDDKARAQALLDVINEINYFTQQKK